MILKRNPTTSFRFKYVKMSPKIKTLKIDFFKLLFDCLPFNVEENKDDNTHGSNTHIYITNKLWIYYYNFYSLKFVKIYVKLFEILC